MIEEEHANDQQLIVGLDNLLKEAASCEWNVHIGSRNCLNVPLCKAEESLSLKLEKYYKIKVDCMSYEALKEREDKLCLILGIEKNPPFLNKMVAEEQLSVFEEHITSLSQKEIASRERFVNIKTKVIQSILYYNLKSDKRLSVVQNNLWFSFSSLVRNANRTAKN